MSGEAQRITRVTMTGSRLCLAGAALGALGLIGWLSKRALLYTLVPGQPPMMPNTGISLLLVGAVGSVVSRRRLGTTARTLSAVAALVVIIIGLGTLAEYALGIDLRIDQLLIRSELGPHPGRPSPPTAMALALLGIAILLFDSYPTHRTRPSEWLLISAALTALVGLTGHILGTESEYRLLGGSVVGMAVPTAVSLLVSSIGMLLGRPAAGIIAVATSAGPGGVLLRRIAVVSVVTPVLLGFGITRLFSVIHVDALPLIVASVAVAVTVAGLATLIVTARVLNRTHEELQASQARTREMIAMASDGVFIADLEGRYTQVNEAGSRMLGMSQEEIVGKTIRDFLRPDEVDRLAAARAALLEGGVQIAEWHLRHKSGAYIPVEISTRMLPGDRWQAFVRDISERKAAEEEARRSKAKLVGIISIAADAIVSIDESQRITIFNRGAEQAFGWTAREVIGQPLDMLIPERFREVHRSHVRAFAEEPTAARRVGDRDRPIYGLRKDGTEFLAEAAISKLRTGDELTFTVVMRDVTREQRRAEQERLLSAFGLFLTSSLERTELLRGAAHLLVGEFADVCVIDLVDDPGASLTTTRSAVAHRDPRKTELARALERLQLDRQPFPAAAEPLQTGRTTLVSQVTPEFLDAIAQSEHHRNLLRELGPSSAIAVPLRAHGLVVGVLTFAITESRRRYDEGDTAFAEEIGQRLALAIDNARLFETATNAVAARDDVLRIVAHDLRNPLGTIVMRASLLEVEAAEGNGRLREAAGVIESAAKRMNRLIRDLLDVTSFEAGHLSVERAAVSARGVVQDAVTAQKALAAKTSLELRWDVPEDIPDVWGDRDRLLQIFENLIGNAMKFTAHGGNIVVGAVRRDRDVMFWVKDTGEGISAEDLLHVFDRFWQGRKQQHEGAGLGLLIVKALVEAHEGRVWVESAPGRGSAFYFTIPIAREAASVQRDAVPLADSSAERH